MRGPGDSPALTDQLLPRQGRMVAPPPAPAMKPPLLSLVSVAVIALYVRGFVSLSTAADTFTQSEARTPALVSGVVCVSIGTGLLVLAMWLSRKQD